MIEPSKEGCKCERCGQFVKLYKRKLNSGMAYVLIKVYYWNLNNDEKFVHIKEFLRKNKLHNGHDWTHLKFWGLLEPKIEDRDDGSNRNGYYQITQKGINFIKQKIKIPKYINIYNKKFYGFAGDLIDIKDALGNKFNYNELMQNE